MAIRAQQFEIFAPVVLSIAIFMLQFQRNRFIQPHRQFAVVTKRFENAFKQQAYAEFVRFV